MRRFLYYFPGRPGMNPKLLERYGVLDRFQRTLGGELLPMSISSVPIGPNENSRGGCIVAAGEHAAEYAPERQTWAKACAGNITGAIDNLAGLFFVGLEQPWPAPEDLTREIIITGPTMHLSDGKAWRLPTIHRWDESALEHVANLPKHIRPKLDGSGALEKVVRAEFQAADLIARELFAGFVASRTLPADEAFAKAARVLALNYRVGPEELGLLGVLNEVNIFQILAEAIDVPAISRQAREARGEGLEPAEVRIQEDDE